MHNLNYSSTFASVKKVFAITLALIYLLVSSGILLEIHHCMGRIANTGITMLATSANDACNQCGMKKSNLGKHCCKDEYKQVKITIDQKPSTPVLSPDAPFVVELAADWPPHAASFVLPANFVAYSSHAPPPLSPNRQSLFCVFRI